jgi:hypothetical protein
MKRQLLHLAAVAILATRTPTASAALLAVDVNDRTAVDAPNSVAGFGQFQLSGTTAAVGSSMAVVDGYTITVTAVNAAGAPLGGIDDRDRATPTTAPTLNQIYDDFLFTAAGVGAGGGIDMAIASGGLLAPNTQYRFSVYSFDSGSTTQTQPRTAAWLDGNNSDLLVLTTSYAGAVAPITDDQYKFTGVAMTDGSGNLLLRARNTTANDTAGIITPGVFVNGFEIDAIPEPAALSLAMAGGIGLLASRRRRVLAK